MFKGMKLLKTAFLSTILIFSCVLGLHAREFSPSELSEKWVPLKEKWDYYPMALLQPFDFYPTIKSEKSVPVTVPHALEPGVRYGTFHYRVKNLVPNKYYATTIYGAVVSCCRFWCNGKLVATSGFLSKAPEDAKAGECNELIDLRADQNGVIDIMIHVANYNGDTGGILKPILITEKPNGIKTFFLFYFFNAFILLFILAHTLYNAILSILTFKRRNHIILLCLFLLLTASTLLTGFSLTQSVLADFPYWLHRKLPVALLCAEASFLLLYEASLFKIPYKRIILMHVVSIMNAIPILFLPPDIFEAAKLVFPGVAISCALGVLAIPSRFITRKKSEEKGGTAQLLLMQNAKAFMGLVIAVLCILDFLIIPNKKTTIHSYFYFKLAIALFAVTQCGVYAFNRDWTLARVDHYSRILSENNNVLSKFISEQILKLMGASDVTKIIPGECRIIDTIILCAQIKHYNQLSEAIERSELFEITQDFYQSVSPIILDSGGFIAKYTIGGFIAIFQQKNSDAITCAARMQNKLKEIRRRLRKNHRTDISVGISIHSGKAAIGTMGTSFRLDTAALSNDVSLACAVATQTSKMNAQILITEEAMPYCRNYIDYMYEGHFFIMEGRQILVYSATKIVKVEETYEETLEVIEDEDEI